jgi:hypothetical protein
LLSQKAVSETANCFQDKELVVGSPATRGRAFRFNSSASLRSACGISASIPCAANCGLGPAKLRPCWAGKSAGKSSLRGAKRRSNPVMSGLVSGLWRKTCEQADMPLLGGQKRVAGVDGRAPCESLLQCRKSAQKAQPLRQPISYRLREQETSDNF